MGASRADGVLQADPTSVTAPPPPSVVALWVGVSLPIRRIEDRLSADVGNSIEPKYIFHLGIGIPVRGTTLNGYKILFTALFPLLMNDWIKWHAYSNEQGKFRPPLKRKDQKVINYKITTQRMEGWSIEPRQVTALMIYDIRILIALCCVCCR